MSKLKKVLIAVLAGVMASSSLCFSALASSNNGNEESVNGNVIDIVGNPGDVFDVGDNLKLVILDEDMYYETLRANGDLAKASSIRYAWSVSDLSAVSWYNSVTKYTFEADLILNDTYPYWRVYLSNTQSSSRNTSIAVYDEDGNAASSIMNVQGNYYYYLYSVGEWYGNYYVGLYSSTALSGSTYGIRASTQSEVDYNE